MLLPLTDGGDQILLAHPTRSGDAQLLRELLEFRQQHRSQAAASVGSTRGGGVGHGVLRITGLPHGSVMEGPSTLCRSWGRLVNLELGILWGRRTGDSLVEHYPKRGSSRVRLRGEEKVPPSPVRTYPGGFRGPRRKRWGSPEPPMTDPRRQWPRSTRSPLNQRSIRSPTARRRIWPQHDRRHATAPRARPKRGTHPRGLVGGADRTWLPTRVRAGP